MRRFVARSLLNPVRFHQSYLFKNARVVNADMTQQADVLIESGKVAEISPSITHKTAQVIDCSGKLLIPGGIDTHAHMQFPFMGSCSIDDFDGGSKAAIAGGTTSWIDFVVPGRNESMLDAYTRWRGWGDGNVNCDWALHSTVTHWNEQLPGEMKRMIEKGVSSFKFFMAYKGLINLEDSNMYKAMEIARQLGALCMVHAENGQLIYENQQKLLKKGITGPQGHYLSRKQSTESDAVHRVITIAEWANCPLYVVHLMSHQAAQQVMRAKNKGNIVFGQTLVAALAADGSKYWDQDVDVALGHINSPVINPDPKNKIQMMRYVNTGIIDTIATDNCTFTKKLKRIGLQSFEKTPNGINGLQDRLAIVWTRGVKTGLLSQNQFVESTSTKGAQIFNMYPRKGVIRVGADADVVVWDPNHKRIISAKTHHHQGDFNIFEGQQVYGFADYTFSNGNLVWNGKDFLNQRKGSYISRETFGHAYSRHKAWTEANDPANFVVDRKNKVQSQVDRLKSQVTQLKIQRDTLLQQAKKA